MISCKVIDISFIVQREIIVAITHIKRNQIIFAKIYSDSNNNNKNKFRTLSNNYLKTHTRFRDSLILSFPWNLCEINRR